MQSLGRASQVVPEPMKRPDEAGGAQIEPGAGGGAVVVVGVHRPEAVRLLGRQRVRDDRLDGGADAPLVPWLARDGLMGCGRRCFSRAR